ncbi:hypothetical protein [Burkholderia gladioli]|uniref:hypothetical protein n=1 Tax=Burkholderia gladioli TaxID=28095 RepID=UPI00163E00B3|nr:hypothetical protein [Burkholderia gladioli]
MTTTNESSKPAWTPGPWELEVSSWDNQRIYGNDARVPGERRFIAEVSLYWDGANANAKLIAAAPELIEALKTLVERIEFYSAMKDDERPNIEQWEYTEGSSDMAKARAALAKAGA